jgi:hypothetical protein
VRHLQPVVDAAYHQSFFAPVELERLAPLERQWQKAFVNAD